MGNPTPLFVGLDVHKDSIAVAHARGGESASPVFVGEIGPRPADVPRLVARLQGKAAELRFVYEAGPVGTACIGISRGRGWRATSSPRR